MTPHPRDAVERSDPVRLICLATIVSTHGLVRLAERYLPEFLSALGYGPIVVGLLVSLGLGTAVAASELSSADLGGDATPALESTTVAVLAALLAAVGLLAWAGAPTLDTLLGTPLTALGWLVVGIVLLQAWHVRGPTRRLWPTDTRAGPLPSSAADDAHARSDRTVLVPDKRTHVVLGALGIVAAAVFATTAVASADSIRGGFALVAATGAAVAIVGAVALGTVGVLPSLFGDPSEREERTGVTSIDVDPSLGVVRRAVSRLPDRRRWAVIGDALVRVAIAGTVPFLVLLVVDYRAIGLSIGGLSLAPAAVFGLFVLAEAAGAIAGAVASPTLASRVDRRLLLAVGLAGLSLLPMALVAAPASAAAVAALFGLLGFRTVIEPLRPTVGASARAAPVPGPRLPDEIRTAVRVAVVPAPLLGGILYAINPLVAFTVATTVGLLGVRELGRAFSFGRDA
ncbi:transporter [Natrinema salsiterrestre]|uniref:Transporter n=1 Tax=Natrinema salsiterrestre TaxID=2950540 RepID=A0A9Q4L151_9EURY|nr:transporter [Natrinema salsiterrestre]MDF9745399.1 transporter [Natrinema salsiterrestre]